MNKYVFNADSRSANDAGVEVICTPAEEAEEVVETKSDEELCHFVHPSVDSSQEWQIHNEIKRLVKRQGIQEICQYLQQLSIEKKVLLPQIAEKAYSELVRLGMPNGDGYSLKTFMKYYKR